jgi:hypothetical protein
MALADSICEQISMEVIKTLVSRFENFPEDARGNRNAPFHEAFLRAFSNKFDDKVYDIPFFITLSSWLQGLNTTLGQSFFENVANLLCCGEKKKFTSVHGNLLKITKRQKEYIAELITKLKNGVTTPDLQEENNILFQEDNTDLTDSIDFTADVFFIDEDSVNAIELKSVKPNSGEMRGEKEKILYGKAALHRQYPEKKINYFIGFPFDPTVDTKSEPIDSCNKERFVKSCIELNKFFAFDEILIAKELWNFLSGQANTMNEIIEIINKIATPQFESKYKMLCDSTEREDNEYTALLHDWNLYTEIELIENKSIIRSYSNKVQLPLLDKSCFKDNGDYNWSRACKLKCLIK